MIEQINFYQAVLIPEVRGRNSFNTLNEEMIPGVSITRDSETICLRHNDWAYDYFVGMANVRYYMEKKITKDQKKKAAVKRNKTKKDANK